MEPVRECMSRYPRRGAGIWILAIAIPVYCLFLAFGSLASGYSMMLIIWIGVDNLWYRPTKFELKLRDIAGCVAILILIVAGLILVRYVNWRPSHDSFAIGLQTLLLPIIAMRAACFLLLPRIRRAS